MKCPSLTLILSGVFLAYILHSIWVLSNLFVKPICTDKPCYTSFLSSNPKLQLALFTSVQSNPVSSEVTKITTLKNFFYNEKYSSNFKIDIPAKTRKNGTLYLHIILALDDGDIDWTNLKRDGPTVIQRIKLTEFMVPRAATFNLLGENDTTNTKKTTNSIKPISHIQSKVYISILTDDISMSQVDIPPEFIRFMRVTRKHEFLPILQQDFLKSRLTDYQEIDKNTTELNIEFNYSPLSSGKLRLIVHVEHALKSLGQLGFTAKDVDEVKGIFSDTNVYLLCGTVFVGSVHLLFDFLSFKNDVSFWRSKKTYAGLSLRTTLWRAFSQIIVFLYLIDEKTSMLILIPTGIGTLIELWKCKKILKIEISLSGLCIKTNDDNKIKQAEQITRNHDKQAMIYLSYLLYPLCICGALYSLIYQPHKSWYSWTINSLVNGVYAFGFLFMLPQLFINYKLKSVAALPWRAFMYKAFNTFIDDIFAFIITMPTAHRVACFRDDIVFIIYLYQRWLYPVDKTRIDESVSFGEQTDTLVKPDTTTTTTNNASDKKKN